MYLPRHFEETRVEVLHALIRAHPLGALVSLAPDGLDANHLPFELDPRPAPLGTLRAHIARANPLWRQLGPGAGVLVIFQGPGAYISPSWYRTKRESGKVVPTWNYAVVHAHGPVRVVEDRTWLRSLVDCLTTQHESARPEPWATTDAPAEFIEAMLGSIVGIEIPVARLVGKWKVSQNRTVADRSGVAEGLRGEGRESAAAMARLVQEVQGP